ncbi:MAG: hypothetical protein D6785_12970 [Planctomycetota bacterium]|nr:MAG: hypothetical protein D6785_12970 [Planctomycetota bacterium]
MSKSVQVRYCNHCGIKISPLEIQKGMGFEFKGTCYCKKCFSKMSKRVQKKILSHMKEQEEEKEKEKNSKNSKRSKKLTKYIQKEKRDQTSSADLPTLILKESNTPPPPSKSSFLWLWMVLGGLALLLFYFFFFSSPPSSSAPPVHPPKKDFNFKKAYQEILDFERRHPQKLKEIQKKLEALLPKVKDENLSMDIQDHLDKIRLKIKKNKKPKKPKKTSQNSSSSSSKEFWASSFASRFHRPSCKWAKKINPRNKKIYHSRKEALQDGKKPCRLCKP